MGYAFTIIKEERYLSMYCSCCIYIFADVGLGGLGGSSLSALSPPTDTQSFLRRAHRHTRLGGQEQTNVVQPGRHSEVLNYTNYCPNVCPFPFQTTGTALEQAGGIVVQ